MQDEDLLKTIVLKDADALAALYDRYGRLVYSLALHMISNSALAEEITQDVFVQVWNKASTFQAERGKAIPWLMSITRHRAIDLIRQQKARPYEETDGWEENEEIYASEEIVELDLEIKQQSKQVREILAHLPAEQMKALTLAYYGGMSHQEIAAFVNEPVGTIKTRIRLAMQKLKQELTQDT